MDSSDEEIFEMYENIVVRRQLKRRVLRERNDLINFFDDQEFLKRFRLSKITCLFICSKIEDALQNKTNRNLPLTPINKLLVTLRFFATGTFQMVSGDLVGVDKSTVSRIVSKVTHILVSVLKNSINFPTEENDLMIVKSDFFKISGFPGVLGALDCTHIPIRSPGGPNAEMFRNRKGWFSVNVQAVCTASLKITNLVARWYGSCHDSTILTNSRLWAQLRSGEIKGGYLLGDGGYACSQHVLTPVLNPKDRAEILYNKAHIRTRNTIERAFGVVKRRFPCLSTGLRVKLETALKCIVICFSLHNLILERGEGDALDDVSVRRYRRIYGEVDAVPHGPNQNAVATRNTIIDMYFRNAAQ